jgi:acetylornithine deacetylase
VSPSGSDDEAILAWLEDRSDEVLEFAQALIRTPSVNPPGDERAVAALIGDRLAALGIEDRTIHAPRPERPNLIARITGDRPGRRLILSGHLDTKPSGDRAAWESDPWAGDVVDGRLRGLGSGDMKAGLAGMVYAAAALRHQPHLAGELQLVLTADEEAGSVHGSRWLAENGLLAADAAVLGEPSGIVEEWEALHLVSRGAGLFRVRVHGTQMHSSVSDRFAPVNATVKMAELVVRAHRELKGRIRAPDHPLGGLGPTVNVGVMATAGVYYGVYPGSAEFACDIRTLPGMTRDALVEDLQAFLADAMADDPQLDAELVFEVWVDATEIRPDEPIVRALLDAAPVALDRTPRLDAFPGATDAPHFQVAAGIPTVAAFGPGLLPRAHSPNEWLDADGPLRAARVYALAARRYLDPEG